MFFIDTHAHLFTEEFDADCDEVLQRAKDLHIEKIVLPNIDTHSIDRIKALAAKYKKYTYPAMGLHPCSVSANYREALAIIEKELFENRNEYIAVGEMGMDLYWDKSFLKEQEDVFKIQCVWACELKIPVIIHSRECTPQLIQILQSLKEVPAGVFHCFSGTLSEAEQIISLGMYLGVGGVVTYKKSDLPDVLQSVPMDTLVLETDAPYLAPVPYRGKRNESSYLIKTAEKIAEIYSVTLNVVAENTTKNAKDLFKF